MEEEARNLRNQVDRLGSECAMSVRMRDEMTSRMDEMGGELRKARMFAAAEEFYVDRRLLGNVVVSYFEGGKAGSDEVLMLLCSILGMSDEQKAKVTHSITPPCQCGAIVLSGFFQSTTLPCHRTATPVHYTVLLTSCQCITQPCQFTAFSRQCLESVPCAHCWHAVSIVASPF